MNKYDIIVIGDDLNGLATAALLAKSDLSTLLVPHHRERIGEKAEFNTHHNSKIFYNWDCSRGAMSYYMDMIGVQNTLKIIKPKWVDRVITPEIDVKRPFGWDAFREMMTGLFPKDRMKLIEFFQTMEALGETWIEILKAGSFLPIKNLKNVMQFKNISYVDFVKGLFPKKDIQDILLATMPIRRVTTPVMAGYLVTQVFDYHFIEGGYKQVYRTIKEIYKREGGEVDLSCAPLSLQPEGGGFRINFTNDTSVICRRVVSTSDERITFKRYVSAPVDQLNKKKKGITAIAPYSVILKMDEKYNSDTFSPYYATYYFPQKDALAWIEESESPQELNHLPLRIHYDTTNHSLILTSDLYSNLSNHENLPDRMLNTLNKKFPVLTHIEKVNTYSPDDIEEDMGYSQGFIWRWAFRGEESILNPFESKLPVEGLFTTGQWGGAWFTSAILASRLVLKSIKRDRSKNDLR